MYALGAGLAGGAGADARVRPGAHAYQVPAPPSDSVAVTALPCDPAASPYIENTPVAPAQTFHPWIGGDGKVEIILYLGWVELSRFTITAVEAPLPPPEVGIVTDLDAPGLSPAFDPSLGDYQAPAGQAADVVVHDGWAELVRYTIHITAPERALRTSRRRGAWRVCERTAPS